MSYPTTEPVLIEGTNLSCAWGRLLIQIADNPGKEIAPLILSLNASSDGVIAENTDLRSALDGLLKQKGLLSIEDVAFTIFPQGLWHMCRGDRAKFFELYKHTFPRWQAMNRKKNGRGLYFERLTMYGRGPCDGNQLEWILSQYSARPEVRRSMLQATTFDPQRDHTASAQLGFPCLQQVSFAPTNSGLVMNAFYATQQVFDKAYGNYLGLAQLGAFMASQMGIAFAKLNVMVGVAKLERITKTDPALAEIIGISRSLLKSQQSSAVE